MKVPLPSSLCALFHPSLLSLSGWVLLLGVPPEFLDRARRRPFASSGGGAAQRQRWAVDAGTTVAPRSGGDQAQKQNLTRLHFSEEEEEEEEEEEAVDEEDE